MMRMAAANHHPAQTAAAVNRKAGGNRPAERRRPSAKGQDDPHTGIHADRCCQRHDRLGCRQLPGNNKRGKRNGSGSRAHQPRERRRHQDGLASETVVQDSGDDDDRRHDRRKAQCALDAENPAGKFEPIGLCAAAARSDACKQDPIEEGHARRDDQDRGCKCEHRGAEEQQYDAGLRERRNRGERDTSSSGIGLERPILHLLQHGRHGGGARHEPREETAQRQPQP